MMKIFIALMLLNVFTMYMAKTPFSLGMILMIQTILITMATGMMSVSFWFSYMLFLIFLGSLLIIFIYVSSLISNVKFFFNKWMMMNYIMLLMMFFFINFNKFNLLTEESINLMELNMKKSLMLTMSLNKLFNKPTFLISFMMINYLFITLIIVVKISNINLGSLRKNF
uniref:NADH dehydrogenase subunit 6 n=1 Tax=Nesodiprion zhejiangensis TaxID=2916818 RepID=A0A9E7VAU3_9HYME|nr:NADH dehydrogenase subunit 6 [Nesodiprion zhejiangensis]UZC33521.1 NADH dehydrogenase subunit 6 [Nesodiprion zhejiangensis]